MTKPFAIDASQYGSPRYLVVEIVKETDKTHEILGGWRGARRPTRIMKPAGYPARFETRDAAEVAAERANEAWTAFSDAVTVAETALKAAKRSRAEAAIKAMETQV